MKLRMRILLSFLGLGVVVAPLWSPAQVPSKYAPMPVSAESFSLLKKHSPFRRSLNVSKSLILTGIAEIENETVATVMDTETRQLFTVSKSEPNREGWQLVLLKGDPSDLRALTAQIRLSGGAEMVSIRYEKPPPPKPGAKRGVMVSTRIGNGSSGGGTGPHGGPDPRVLTPDQLKDARNAARNIKSGFQADGYADGDPIPPQVLSKISKLSVQQRENVNVKMFEYRNKGLGMKERQQIYNRLLDSQLQQKK